MLHDNHLMRFVPLVPSEFDPAPWSGFQAVELAWNGRLHGDWTRLGIPVHAIHFGNTEWDESLGQAALAALRERLDLDFLVFASGPPGDRLGTSRFLSVLEGLLEITHGSGVKLALRPAPGAAPGLVKLLREVHGEAVGFCWDAAAAPDLDWFSDRLFCAVAAPGDDLEGLRALGYRWNVALPIPDPAKARAAAERLAEAYPTVYFPSGLEGPADPHVKLGPGPEGKP